MRHFFLILISLLSVIALGSCTPEPHYVYGISVAESVGCPYDAEVVEFEYTLHSDVDTTTIKLTATSPDSWITSIDTSVIGKVVCTLEPNSGASRTSTITLSAPDHVDSKIRVVQFATPPAVARHTLMFMFMGTSLERYFKTNVDDATKAIKTGLLGDSNRVLLFRQSGKTKAYISELCYDAATGEFAERRVVSDIALSQTLVTPEDVAGFIDLMAEDAPAERYGIVMAGHGQAWIQRSALDDTGAISTFSTTYSEWTPQPGAEITRAYGEKNVLLDIEDIAKAIELSSVELDYILFDACFMSNVETLYDLRNSANYIIASPCEIMGRGFPYERTLPYLFDDNGHSTDYVKAAESYYKFYRDEYVGSSRCGSIAVVDCHELEALADVTRELVDWKKFYKRETLQAYEGQSDHYFFDFGQWGNLFDDDSTKLERFNAQLNKAVVAKFSLDTFYSAYGTYGTYPIDLDVYSGITTSTPTESKFYYNMRETNWYQSIRPETANE